MKYISTLIILILFSFISTAQNSKNIPRIFHKKLLNSIAGRYAKVDVTMGYAKGTGGITIGNPNQSKYSLFNDFSFSIYVLRGQDQQFGSITNITTESNNLNDFLIRFNWNNKRTDQGTISGEIQLFYSLSKERYETYFINNSSSIFKIFWWTELDQSQKDSLNSIINILYKKELESILSVSGKPIDIKELHQLNIEKETKENKLKEDLILIQKNEQQALNDRNKSESLQKIKDDELYKRQLDLYNASEYVASIVGNTITLKNLIIAQNDFAEPMIWEVATEVCKNLGEGWRLPDIDELKYLYTNKNLIGGFSNGIYWSSSESDRGNYHKYISFNNGNQFDYIREYDLYHVRAVKSLKSSSNSIIGKTIKIDNLEVAEKDFPNLMNWEDAQKECKSLGYGWHLPTEDELKILYKNKNKIGGFTNSFYWSSSEGSDGFGRSGGWIHEFVNFLPFKTYNEKSRKLNVRAVRTLK